MPAYTAGLAAHQLGDVGILFLRHDRRAGAVAVGQADEIELRARPQHQFFRHARQVSHAQRGRGAEFDREIAVADGVDRVAAGGIETKYFGGELAVEIVRGAGQCGGAERHLVHARGAIPQPAVIAFEHFEPGQQLTGCATCKWVKPGRIVSASRSARSSKPF